MFDYFKKKKEKRLADEHAMNQYMVQAQEERRVKDELYQKQKQDEFDHEIRMDSSVAWYKLIGKPYDIEHPPVEPIGERYQWNKAFIRSLREQGYKGEIDYQVISDWETKNELDRVKRLVALDRENKKNSDEPWVDIESERFDPESKQVAIRLDWNNAFIKMLRQNGYTGKDEQELVDKWFKQLSEDIAGELHGESFE